MMIQKISALIGLDKYEMKSQDWVVAGLESLEQKLARSLYLCDRSITFLSAKPAAIQKEVFFQRFWLRGRSPGLSGFRLSGDPLT